MTTGKNEGVIIFRFVAIMFSHQRIMDCFGQFHWLQMYERKRRTNEKKRNLKMKDSNERKEEEKMKKKKL